MHNHIWASAARARLRGVAHVVPLATPGDVEIRGSRRYEASTRRASSAGRPCGTVRTDGRQRAASLAPPACSWACSQSLGPDSSEDVPDDVAAPPSSHARCDARSRLPSSYHRPNGPSVSARATTASFGVHPTATSRSARLSTQVGPRASAAGIGFPLMDTRLLGRGWQGPSRRHREGVLSSSQ